MSARRRVHLNRAHVASAHFLLVWGLMSAGCASTEHQAKKRDFSAGEYAQGTKTSTGSLFQLGGGGLIEDNRATQVGDVVVIRVDENDSASHDSATRLDRKSELGYGLSGALERASPTLNLQNLFGAKSDSSFAGAGRVQRRGQVSATLPVRVQRVLPNGDLYVEGTKNVKIGEEERYLYVSGIVRPSDVRFDGSVSSSRIADAQIEYTGAGDVSDQQEPGWLTGILAKIWPF